MTTLQKINHFLFPYDSKPYHFKALDGLRGIAVLFVVFSHLNNNHILLFKFFNFSTAGKYGVYLFYVLSSYLLDKQIILKLINNKADLKYWIYYALRRFFRIIPLYFLILIINYFLNLNDVYWSLEFTQKEIINHFLLLEGKDIFWSIPVEFKYYILSPFLMVFIHKFLNWKIKSITMLFSILMLISVILNFIFRFNNVSLIKYLPIFLFGSLIAIYDVFNFPSVSLLEKKQFIFKIFYFVSITLIFLSIPYYFNLLFNTQIKHFHHPIYFPFYSILWGIILFYNVKFKNSSINFIFKFKPLRWIGNISFSMYLTHLFVISYFIPISINSSLKFLLILLISIFISSISYFIIERNLNFKFNQLIK